ncbi:hypothetical protein Tco_1539194 [Tanacetum coccineum]
MQYKTSYPRIHGKLSDFLKVNEDDRVMSRKDEILCPCKNVEMVVVGNTSVSENNKDDDLPINNDRRNLNENLDDLDDDVAQKEHAKFEKLFVAAEKALFGGCTKLTILSAMIKMFKIKPSFSWSDISFTTLLEFLHQEMLPEDNELPIPTYQAKKIMCPMDLEIERIDACPNDCMLYRNNEKDLHACKGSIQVDAIKFQLLWSINPYLIQADQCLNNTSVPTGSVVTTGSVIVPAGSVIVPTGSVVTTGSVIVPAGSVVTTGSVIVPAGSVIVPTGSVVTTAEFLY